MLGAKESSWDLENKFQTETLPAAGAGYDPAKGHVSLVRYPLAVLARGACPEADALP